MHLPNESTEKSGFSSEKTVILSLDVFVLNSVLVIYEFHSHIFMAFN